MFCPKKIERVRASINRSLSEEKACVLSTHALERLFERYGEFDTLPRIVQRTISGAIDRLSNEPNGSRLEFSKNEVTIIIAKKQKEHGEGSYHILVTAWIDPKYGKKRKKDYLKVNKKRRY